MQKKNSGEEIKIKMLKLIKKNPGIRPRELHRILGIEHSASIRNSLIGEGLVRKEKKGNAAHYYPVVPRKKA